jgi:hypothetical protein
MGQIFYKGGWVNRLDKGTFEFVEAHTMDIGAEISREHILYVVPYDVLPELIQKLETHGMLPKLESSRDEDLKIVHRLIDLLGNNK